jgi:hypothetical protein
VIDTNTRGAAPTDRLDTIQLADSLDVHEPWAAHLDYLRDLQRVGRETLARAGD